MKRETQVILLSVFFGLLVWVLNALSDYFFFYREPFLDLLILNVPPIELYIRLIVIVFFLAFGAIVVWRMARRRKFERKLIQRERYLSCLADISAELLAASDPVEATPGVLRRMLEVSGAGRCYLFENHRGPSGETLTSQRFEVCAEGVEPQMDNPDLQNVHWIERGFSRWVDEMTAGRAISGRVAGFPGSERAVLEPQDIHWILALPLHVAGEWHGFIGLDACRSGLKWTGQEIDLLRTASNFISSAIGRSKTEERFRMIFNKAKDGMFIETADGRIVDVNKAACRMLGYTREELCSMRVKDLMPSEIAAQLPETIQGETVRDGKYIETVNVRKDGTRLPVEVSGTLVEIWGEKMVIAILRDITERKKAEEELLESEEKYRALIETTDTGYQILDGAGRVIDANPEFVRLTGHKTLDEIVGRTVIEWTAAHDKERNAEELKKCMEKGFVRNLEMDYVDNDGNITPIEINAKVVETAEGLRILSLCRDITKRKLAEKKLKGRMERIARQQAAILELSKEAFLDLDFALRRIMKVDALTLVIERVNIWLFNEDRSELVCLQNYRRSKDRYEEGGRLSLKRYPAYFKVLESSRIVAVNDAWSDPRTCEFTASYLSTYGITSMMDVPIRLHGEIIGLICHEHVGSMREWTRDEQDFAGSMADMVSLAFEASERVQAKEALQKSQDRYRTLLRNIPQKVFYKDLNSTYVLCNESYAGDLKIEPEEFKGKTDYDFFPKELADKYIADDRRIMESGKIEVMEEKYVIGDKQAVVQTFKAPVRDEKGDIIGIFGIFWDITDRKRAEEQLRHAQKMEAVGTLAGGLAHDFNNILAGIMGYASLAKMGLEKSSPLADDMESIEKLSRRGADLTQALLTFSRKGEYHPRPLGLNRVIDDVLKVMGRTAGKRVNIEPEMSPDVSNVMGDEGQLTQVIMNLCLNACEAMPEGGTLTVQTAAVKPGKEFYNIHPVLREGLYVAVSISDTGQGMDDETREHIFEPFFTTKAERSGTGLGLSIVSGIVESHGGCIEVESEPGSGTTFTVYIPATAEEEPVLRPGPPGTLRGHETILIVDDEEGFRLSARRWLNELGYATVAAANGEAALEVVREMGNEVDVVLLDMVMKGMGGAEVFKKMREVVPGLPVIICTGYSITGAARRTLEAGAADLIQKPFDMTELALKIRKVLDHR
ncbi:MAG: PAS domain S-box protein [Candidatus Tritonobacter lacicola]|nr:PAS domain S-box protein [Candidatus Tritonobacter lacicola]